MSNKNGRRGEDYKQKEQEEPLTVKKSDSKEIKWRDFGLVMVALDILLLIFAVAIVVVWQQELKSLLYEETSLLCLPCSQIKVHKDDDWINLNQFKKKTEKGQEICCADNEEKLDKLVDLFVDRNYKLERVNGHAIPNCISNLESKSFDNREKPLARLTGIIGTPKDYSSYIIHWDDENDPSYIGPHLNYSDGRFIIGKAGYYHVYSQVTFMDKKVGELRHYSTKQYIYHRRKKAPKKSQMSLIHSATPKCQLKSDRTSSSNYIGAVVYLDEGDEIGVKITEPNCVSSSPQSNYFGLHVI